MENSIPVKYRSLALAFITAFLSQPGVCAPLTHCEDLLASECPNQIKEDRLDISGLDRLSLLTDFYNYAHFPMIEKGIMYLLFPATPVTHQQMDQLYGYHTRYHPALWQRLWNPLCEQLTDSDYPALRVGMLAGRGLYLDLNQPDQLLMTNTYNTINGAALAEKIVCLSSLKQRYAHHEISLGQVHAMQHCIHDTIQDRDRLWTRRRGHQSFQQRYPPLHPGQDITEP